MISIITVVNHRRTYEQYLYPSLLRQTGVDPEIIEIDNTGGQYTSLGDAYRAAEGQIHGEWLLFVHPDVVFEKENDLACFLSEAERTQKESPEYKLWGAAGAKAGERKEVVTRIIQGPEREKRDCGFHREAIVEVQTVDACCFLMPRETYETFGFSTSLRGFHLLAEELCLRIAASGGKIGVLPIELWHLSPGSSLDYRYYLETLRVFRLHPELNSLNTTSFHWERNGKLYWQLRYLAIRNYVHHRLRG